jgi:hypothetical protein
MDNNLVASFLLGFSVSSFVWFALAVWAQNSTWKLYDRFTARWHEELREMRDILMREVDRNG